LKDVMARKRHKLRARLLFSRSTPARRLCICVGDLAWLTAAVSGTRLSWQPADHLSRACQTYLHTIVSSDLKLRDAVPYTSIVFQSRSDQ